jgi:hypothetical protein
VYVSVWLLCLFAVLCRAAVVFLNIPLVIIGTRGYAVLSLFLVANLLTTCGLGPIVLGLITPLRGFVTETGACNVIGSCAGLVYAPRLAPWLSEAGMW